jgi:D-3-phosphoglycerate dehydrogenase
MDILITELILGGALNDLKRKYGCFDEPDLWRDGARLHALLLQARALIVRNQTLVTRELLAHAPRLEIIGRFGVGVDNLDVPAISEAGVVISYTPEENAVSVAEHTFALLFVLTRRIVEAHASTKAGNWDRATFLGTDLYGKTFGILGLGKIGFRVALRARAFGMNVLAYDPYLSPHAAAVTESGATLADLETALRESNFISVHLPLTNETRGLLNYERLCLMKPSAFLLNLARGPIIVESDLERALREGKLAGAGLDVREEEPPKASGLNELPNVILTPHIAAFTRETQEKVTATIVRDVDAVLSGGEASSYLNFPRPQKRS